MNTNKTIPPWCKLYDYVLGRRDYSLYLIRDVREDGLTIVDSRADEDSERDVPFSFVRPVKYVEWESSEQRDFWMKATGWNVVFPGLPVADIEAEARWEAEHGSDND